MTKTRRSIEDLLKWTYTQELPKDGATQFLRPSGFGFGWGSGLQYMANIDEAVNRYGVPIDKTAQAAPHPDAKLIHTVVGGLDELEFDLPEDWYPLSDICPLDGDLGPAGLAATLRGLRRVYTVDQNGCRYLKRSVADFVRSCAILGPPDWRGDPPVVRKVCHENGKPRWFLREVLVADAGNYEIEADGYDKKRKCPKPGAYQKTYLQPDPIEVVERRAEYQILISAWAAVFEALAGRMEQFEAEMSDRPAWPWEDGDRPAPRILTDGREVRPIKQVPRPRALPPMKRGEHGSVRTVDKADS